MLCQLLWAVADGLALTALLALQLFWLSYHLVHYHDGSPVWYFLFLADFIIVLIFAVGSVAARKQPKSLQRFGLHPLLWFCWLVYALLLTFKIMLIHRTDTVLHILNHVNEQIIKLIYALSAVIFLLWTHLHYHQDKKFNRQLKTLASSAMLEIFDAVYLLDPILSPNTDPAIAEWLAVILLVVSCISFGLPAVGLFRLSQADFTSHQLETSLAQHALKLLAVDAPYFCIRIVIWAGGAGQLSIFVLKNLLLMWSGFKEIFHEVNALRMKPPTQRRSSEDNSQPLAVVTNQQINREQSE